MEDEEKQSRFQALVVEWQEKLGLLEWEVRSTFVAKRDTCRADIQIDNWRKQAMIRVNDDELEDHWSNMAVHELLHLVIKPWSLVTLKFIARLPAGERELAEAWRFEVEEGVVERLTIVLTGRPAFPPGMKTSWREVE